jgi:hypothetical protein
MSPCREGPSDIPGGHGALVVPWLLGYVKSLSPNPVLAIAGISSDDSA